MLCIGLLLLVIGVLFSTFMPSSGMLWYGSLLVPGFGLGWMGFALVKIEMKERQIAERERLRKEQEKANAKRRANSAVDSNLGVTTNQ